ncbi:flagellar assembly protein A [Undibacterium arcticum]
MANFSLKVAADLMSARLTLIPPQGGRAVAGAVRAALQEQGIVHGIFAQSVGRGAGGRCMRGSDYRRRQLAARWYRSTF